FGDVEEQSGIVEMDFRGDRTDRWRRRGRGAQRAGRIRNGTERTAIIVKVEPGNVCRRRPVYPVIEDIDQVPADRNADRESAARGDPSDRLQTCWGSLHHRNGTVTLIGYKEPSPIP